MAEKMILLCDRCQSEEDVARVRIQHQDSTYDLDLCARHRKPILALLPYGRESVAGVGDRSPYEKVSLERLEEEAGRAGH